MVPSAIEVNKERKSGIVKREEQSIKITITNTSCYAVCLILVRWWYLIIIWLIINKHN